MNASKDISLAILIFVLLASFVSTAELSKQPPMQVEGEEGWSETVIPGILASLKAQLVKMSSAYPELVGARDIHIHEALEGTPLCGLDYFHNCKYWGTRGYKDTGSNAVHISFKITTQPKQGEDFVGAVQMPNLSWPNLNLVGWIRVHVGKDASPGFEAKVREVLQQHVEMINKLDQHVKTSTHRRQPDVQVDRIDSLDQVDLTDEDFKVLKMKLAINATMPQWAKGGRFPKIRLNDFDKQIIDSQIVALIPENTNTPVYYGLALYPSTALAEMGLEKAFLRNTAPPSISTWPTTGDRRRGSVVVKENIIIYADKTTPYTDAMISRVVKRIDIMLNTLPEHLVARSADANHFFKIVGDYHFTPQRESAMREFLNSDPSIPWRLEALKWLCYHIRSLERLEQWVKDLERFHEQFGRTPLPSPSFDDAKQAVKRIREIDSKLNNLKNESKAAELLFEKADIVRRTVCDRPATLTLYMEILKDFPETGYENKVFEEIPQLMTEDSRLDQMLLHKLLDDPSWGTAHQYNKLTVYLLAKTYVSKEYPNEALLLIKACLNRTQGAATIEKELSSKAIKGIPSYFDNDTFVDPFVRLARLYKRVDPAAWEQFSKKLNQQHGYNKRVHLRLESINRQAEKPAPQVEREEGWGEAVGGLQCRLYIAEYDADKEQAIDHLTFEIRNISSRPITIPLYNNELPILDVCIEGYPELKTPTSYGDARATAYVVQPEETFARKLSGNKFGNYMIAYGRVERSRGWIPFDPAGKNYRLWAIMEWSKDEIALVGPHRPVGIEKKIKCWTGRLVSNTVSLTVPARGEPAVYWPPADLESKRESEPDVQVEGEEG